MISEDNKNTLLIVDDTPANIMSLTAILKQDYSVYAAGDGKTALELAEKFMPDLILLDIMMPGMDGFEVLAKLHKSDKTKSIPVIFITGLSDNDDENEGFKLGAADYIKRPFDPTIVRHRIRNQIQIVNLRRDLEKALEAAKAANRAKSDFLANMNHEIRTPMNVIAGLTELMTEGGYTDDEAKDYLGKINAAANTLLGLINDVLDISKIEAGKLTLNPVRYDVPALLSDIINVNIFRIADKPIKFKLDISGDVCRELIGDDLRVRQILNNLLSNAFKYTKEGEVKLTVKTIYKVTERHFSEFRIHNSETDNADADKQTLDTAPENYCDVIITVSDTGIGMREEDIAKLFTDYSRVETQANRKIEGTGLGLSITKKLLALMNGDITVESRYGKGSTFTACFKQGFVSDECIGDSIAGQLRDFSYKRETAGIRERPDLSYASVLVVDDFPANLDVAKGLLTKYKMRVDCASSGQEAIDMIKSGMPVYSAVFMDHMMPGMDGIEATKHIRSLETDYARMIPIIALTANAIAENERMFLENGFNAFLSKPVSAKKMDTAVREWIMREDTGLPGKNDGVASSDAKTSSKKETETDTAADKTQTSINIPGINTEMGMELYEDDEELFAYIIESFAEHTPGEVAKLHNVTAENLREYAMDAHTIKGSAAGIGAEQLEQFAKKMEMMGKAGDLQGVLAENDAFIRETEKLIADINKWKSSR